MKVTVFGYQEGEDDVYLFIESYDEVPPLPDVGDTVDAKPNPQQDQQGPWRVVSRHITYVGRKADNQRGPDVSVHLACKKVENTTT